jgi:hypothetical protein
MYRREFIAGVGAAAAGAVYQSSPIYAQAVGGLTHRTVDANGIRRHFAEQGEGPIVVMCHGFPECRSRISPTRSSYLHSASPKLWGQLPHNHQRNSACDRAIRPGWRPKAVFSIRFALPRAAAI